MLPGLQKFGKEITSVGRKVRLDGKEVQLLLPGLRGVRGVYNSKVPSVPSVNDRSLKKVIKKKRKNYFWNLSYIV